jgi:hypothetical protein
MKLFHALFILLQLLPALFKRDENQIAYLKYLWSSYFDGNSPSGHHKENTEQNLKYRETKSEANTHEYSLLLER